jgi:anti-sigma B factor antagonist
MALQTSVEQVDGPTPVTVVALDGELDGASFEGVIDTVRDLYAAGTRHLVLDLSGLTFISSAGLVAVHGAMRILRGERAPDTEQGWEALRAIRDEVEEGSVQPNVHLAGTQEAVQKVLDRTGLGPMLPSFPDRAAAAAAF